MYFQSTTLLFASLLFFTATAREIAFYWSTGCTGGYGVVCRPGNRPVVCCSSGSTPFVSVATISSYQEIIASPSIRQWACALPGCGRCDAGPYTLNNCISPGFALFSAQFGIPGIRQPAETFIMKRDVAATSVKSQPATATSLLFETKLLVPPPVLKEDCMLPNAVIYVDDDGEEVVADIPDGKVEEYVQAVKRKDRRKLKGLKGKKMGKPRRFQLAEKPSIN